MAVLCFCEKSRKTIKTVDLVSKAQNSAEKCVSDAHFSAENGAEPVKNAKKSLLKSCT